MRLLSLLVLGACATETTAPRFDAAPTPEAIAPIAFRRTRRLPRPPITLTTLVERGTHTRFVTANGPVHVWTPRNYDARRAALVIYVHGYYVHVDDAWEDYDLPSQFAASQINAMFIAPEAPESYTERVFWPSLPALLAAVDAKIDLPIPRKRLVAIGHSAAFRTLLGWLPAEELDTVVLLDAAYGEIEEYRNWIEASPDHRFINVGDASTRAWTDQLHAALPDTFVLDGFPTVDEGIPLEAARARILYIKSDLGHFPLVTNGTSIPMILRTLRANKLFRRPLADLLQSP